MMRRHPLRPDRASLVGIAAAAVLASTCVSAQIFTGAIENPSVAMPGTSMPQSPVPVPVPLKPAASAPRPRDMLRYLPNTAEGLRINGEMGDLSWPVYLTGAQARAITQFRLATLSAVSVLPDASSIEVKINGHVIGSDILDGAAGQRMASFVVPADALQPGYNAISLSLQQRHRVDCSVAASYELWTKIDPSETGLALGTDPRGVTDIRDLAALLPRADGTLPIHIMMSGKTNPAHLQRLIAATQQIALAGHALQPAVDFSADSHDIYGVDLAVGTRAALGRIPRLADHLGTTGPLATVLPALAAGRPTLVLSGTSADEVDQAIASLGIAAEANGAPAGLAALALYPARKLAGNETIPLHDLGIRSAPFDGRFFRKSLDIRLPADFLASDYGRGTLDLAGAYAAGLVRGSQVRVDVNGRNAGIVKLPDANGAIFKHNQLFLPLSLMRPGLNNIDIIAETPRPEDAVCAATSGPRFVLLDSSELSLPVLAHVERLPDLALATAGALPFVRGTARLVVPKPDRETMSAALSLTARVAVAAGHPVPFRFATRAGNTDDGSTLVVSAARQLDPTLMTQVGLDPAQVETAWKDAVPAPAPIEGAGEAVSSRWWLTSSDGPSACRAAAALQPMSTSAAGSTPRPRLVAEPALAPSDDLLDPFADADAAPGWRDRLVASAAHAIGWIESLAEDAVMRTKTHDAVHGVTPSASLILAEGMSPGSRDNVTTIVTAADASTLRASMACLFDPAVWPKIGGRLAVLNAANGDVTVTPAGSFHYVASGRTSLANSRLVLAGWFSLNPFAFAITALVLALMLSGTTLWFVRGVGRRSK